MKPNSGLLAISCASLILLASCGGGGGHNNDSSQTAPAASVTDPTSKTPNTTSSSTSYASTSAYFTAQVQGNLTFCKTCHVPGGIATKSDLGKKFLLSNDPSQDYDNLHTSWVSLGQGVANNRILTMPSDANQGHSGGQPWLVGSAPYNAMHTLLSCWDNPSTCTVVADNNPSDPGTPTPPTNTQPLLGSSHGGHVWTAFCEGKPDDAALPPDPRSLVLPGTNTGKAVIFNAYWQDCHVDTSPEDQAPTTCGDFRARLARGTALIEGDGAIGAGTTMGGDAPTALMNLPSDMYNNLWKVWGLKSRPADFDKMVEQRYGFALSAKRNPYPLPGEDPNLTDGGSGQLPMAFTQIRGADGSYSGKLGVTCAICHSARIDVADPKKAVGPLHGLNGISDLAILLHDMDGGLGGLVPFSMNKLRGTGNITNFQIFGLLTLFDKEHLTHLQEYLPVFKNPTTGTEDSPTWWNLGHRPAKFFDGGQPGDAQRIELSAYFPLADGTSFLDLAKAKTWIEKHDQDSDAYLMTVKSPSYPGTIDTKLAEQGAVLFHTKNLWAPQLNNPVPKPDAGNGSCASCHGAYSPQFVNDPNYLDSPQLEGIASYIAPERIIGTDSARVDGNNETISKLATKEFFAYKDQPQCTDQNLASLRNGRELGYLAPPLYGVWASAPYFHNGSVPNVWGVLKPSDRPTYWSRVSTPTPVQQAGLLMGFDTSYDRAYDTEKMGWKYNLLSCGMPGLQANVNCDPNDDTVQTEAQKQAATAYETYAMNYNFQTPLFNQVQMENRKIYNTHDHSQDNHGHEFTAVLTDDERKAIMEYLKTL